ncbi:hypothetical protein JCM8547_003196 [Rhodosporidiobolus lusitaniae]
MSTHSHPATLEKGEDLQLEFVEGVARVDPAAERRLVRKLDLILTPLFFSVYCATFVDRANVGNAKVAGLEKDLGLVGYQYNIGLTVFYIFYALCEMPSNSVCKFISPRWWIPIQVVAFGAVCLATGFVHNYAGFITARVFLGIAEAGVLPALALVLSRFYKRDELVLRIGYFVSAAALAGGFGGLLASGFISAGSILGPVWANIFVFEGAITIGLGLVVAVFSTGGPHDAWWLTAEQRELAINRLKRPTSSISTSKVSGTQQLLRYLATPTPWICAFGYLACNVTVQGVSLFSPTILRALYPGMKTVQIQLRSVPPYAVAFVWTIFLTFISSKINRRGIVMLCSFPFALAGYAIFVATDETAPNARYGGVFLNILGAFPGGPFWMAWGIGCAATDLERATASGLIPGFGQLGAIIATWTYLPTDAPNYYQGNKMQLGFTSLNVFLAFLMLVYVKRENRVRQNGGRDDRMKGGEDEIDEVSRLGINAPSWRFCE